MAAPLLSISMIFRDDIRCIERCLQALTPLRQAIPCELIMADTGSVDGSREIAEKYADEVFDFPWIGDFSAARNAVLDHCSGIWRLAVDTDEYLDPDFSGLLEFLLDPANLYYEGCFITIRNYFTDEMIEEDGEDCIVLRLMRAGVQFSGKIHESLQVSCAEYIYRINGAVFHHDGYAEERMKNKKRRNMPSLQKALQEQPDNLRTICECMDASLTDEEFRKYIGMALPLIKKGIGEEVYYGATMIRDAVCRAVIMQWAEAEAWIRFAFKHFPDSPFVQGDVSFYAAVFYVRSAPAKSVRFLRAFWEAMDKYNRQEYPWALCYAGTMKGSRASAQNAAEILMVQALRGLKQWKKAAEALDKIDLVRFVDKNSVRQWMANLAALWWESREDLRDILAAHWKALQEDTSNLAEEKRSIFLSTGCVALNTQKDGLAGYTDPRPIADLFSVLGEDCVLGRASLMLQTQDAQEMKRLLAEVDAWEYIPAQAVLHGAELGAEFPESFYKMPDELQKVQTDKLAACLEDRMPEILLAWVRQLPKPDMHQLSWLYNLALSTVLSVRWKDASCEPLPELYRGLAEQYMRTFYQPAMLQEENLNRLPADLRYGWYLSEAQRAKDGGNLPQYIRLLRKGLKEAHGFKKMTFWLSAKVEKQLEEEKQNQNELQALANQVKLLLSTYPADHPAVQAVLQSDVYQKIAHLLG